MNWPRASNPELLLMRDNTGGSWLRDTGMTYLTALRSQGSGGCKVALDIETQ